MGKRSAVSRFPVARIKKLIQSDKDVGKVSQATPVLISKALELFIGSIVEATVDETRKSGARKVTPYHLKRTVHTNEIFDFLKDIVAKVPDPIDAPGPSGSGSGSTAARRTSAALSNAGANLDDGEDGEEQRAEDDFDDVYDDAEVPHPPPRKRQKTTSSEGTTMLPAAVASSSSSTRGSTGRPRGRPPGSKNGTGRGAAAAAAGPSGSTTTMTTRGRGRGGRAAAAGGRGKGKGRSTADDEDGDEAAGGEGEEDVHNTSGSGSATGSAQPGYAYYPQHQQQQYAYQQQQQYPPVSPALSSGPWATAGLSTPSLPLTGTAMPQYGHPQMVLGSPNDVNAMYAANAGITPGWAGAGAGAAAELVTQAQARYGQAATGRQNVEEDDYDA
ncbi:hypothetical protein CF319_g5961 [Tilletia indica]|nr:hypothetical protein CF319_g5961 [Tilletia indica]